MAESQNWERLTGKRAAKSYVERRGKGFPFLGLSRRSIPSAFAGQTPTLEFGRANMFADSYRPVTDGAALVSGEVMAFFRSTLAIAENREPEIPCEKVLEIIDGYISRGTLAHLRGEELRVFLMAFMNTFYGLSNFNRTNWIALLDTLPDDCACTDELVGALSISSEFRYWSLADSVLIDKLLERAFGLVVSGEAREARPVFLSLTYRLSRPEPVDFGPGKGLKGRASTLANLLAISPLLKHPSQACLPLVCALTDTFSFTLTWETWSRPARGRDCRTSRR
ncbi:MAG: hypothetical protein LBT40_16665 [Deltaproteobacteria bacterium]|jgi:hypothetical protein|nr:hypothetical protein [Deltaproteobacteria bacterium]